MIFKYLLFEKISKYFFLDPKINFLCFAFFLAGTVVSIKVSINVSIKAEAGLDRVGWIRSSMVRGKIRLT